MTIEIAGVEVTIDDDELREVLGVIASNIFEARCIDNDDMLIDFKYDYLEGELENAINKSLQSKYIEAVCDPDYWKDEIDRLERSYEE